MYGSTTTRTFSDGPDKPGQLSGMSGPRTFSAGQDKPGHLSGMSGPRTFSAGQDKPGHLSGMSGSTRTFCPDICPDKAPPLFRGGWVARPVRVGEKDFRTPPGREEGNPPRQLAEVAP